MTVTPDTSEYAVSGVGRPPGTRLRQARERMGLELREVAESLRLGSDLIDALEHDRYERLPPPAFVRGYLRSYAELVGVPVDEVLRAHEHVQPRHDTLVPNRHAGSPVLVGQRQRQAASMVGVALLALAIGGVWWVTGEQGDTVTVAEPVYATLQDAVARDDLARALGQPVMLPAGAEVVDEDGDTSAASPDAELTRTAPELSDVDAGAIIEPGDATGNGSRVAPAAPEAGADAGHVAVEVVTSADSWVEIEDSGGEPLLQRLMAGGERETVDARLPLRLFVGDVDAVEVRVNGEVLDVGTHRRANNTARLVIEQPAAASP